MTRCACNGDCIAGFFDLIQVILFLWMASTSTKASSLESSSSSLEASALEAFSSAIEVAVEAVVKASPKVVDEFPASSSATVLWVVGAILPEV